MKRIIPILLIKDRLLYKTINFKNATYIGDPFIALKIFNEKEVDELIVLDINNQNKEPDFEFLNDLASEAFMPLSYGGGISNIDYAEKIFRIGFEKVVLNTANYSNFDLLSLISGRFGSQAVICAIDYKISLFKKRSCVFMNSSKSINKNIIQFINEAVEAGAGEILLQCVNFEGTMEKMDISFIKTIVDKVNVPVIGTGGSPSHKYIKEFFDSTNASALAAGSIFVYHGPLKGVLINYPSYDLKEELIP